VLDPEQNHTFSDHYLEVDFDLSDVMFVATANTLNIPGPLLDRMEVIRIPGYTEDEKANIATRYLVPKQLKAMASRKRSSNSATSAIRDIIRYYTREAGVRNLEREISKICRKVVKQLLREKICCTYRGDGQPGEVPGRAPLPLRPCRGERSGRPGDRPGLDRGGRRTADHRATVVPGKGKLIHTGQLGDVMQESIQAAMTVVRSRSRRAGHQADFYQKLDIHVHVPEGATPKDGPSAGVGMCTALVSA
jgi:ATP-dependent Lon protease